MQAIFKMLTLNNAPTVPIAEDDAAADVDEPPDQVPALHHFSNESQYPKAPSMPPNLRRESLLTRAIRSDSVDTQPQYKQFYGRGLSTTSSHSAMSQASTAELTSDASPTHSCTPSPPVPNGFTGLSGHKPISSQVVIAPLTQDDKPAVAEIGEAAVEKTLGRKRCIMFACGGTSTPEPKEEPPKELPEEEPKEEPPKRKCRLTFACPTRQESTETSIIEAPKRQRRSPSPKPAVKDVPAPKPAASTEAVKPSAPETPLSPQTFHEFGSSHDETDSWVHHAQDHTVKLTVTDCMKKENAIRKLGEEAEEEAEEEEREEEENMDDMDDQAQEDDFAPSDDGNDSDDEAGFADSDDESDAGSDYQFWAPGAQSSTTAATSTDNVSHISNRGRSRASSLESLHSTSPPRMPERPMFMKSKSRSTRLRPGTPELPDSTDFVCGTLDEDRPLEAAYISCLEQRKRERHIPIPQDIDPSFPTSDPEDENDQEDDDEDESPGAGGPMWMKNQFDDFDVQAKTPQATKSSSPTSPRNEFPFPRPQLSRRITNRSPPPKPRCRSPPPPRGHNLFEHRDDADVRPAPYTRLRSPPASPRVAPAFIPKTEIGIRPFGRGRRERTASLPRTPNPFFKHFNVGSPSISNVASGAVTPATEEPPRGDIHVRGPVDIVMGLERKRQKRKEKFWRQHCRKAAKEYAERKPVPGRGASRMKELGLECAERNRGYGIPGVPGQSTQLVISL